MNARTPVSYPSHPMPSTSGRRFGAGAPRSSRVYLWRRLLVLIALACVVWGSLWGVFRLGGLLGAQLIAPALGTAPVPVVDGPQAGA